MALSGFQAELNNLRPLGRFTHDSFSRAWPASPRKSLIFLDLYTAVQPAVSDNGQGAKRGPAQAPAGNAHDRCALHRAVAWASICIVVGSITTP